MFWVRFCPIYPLRERLLVVLRSSSVCVLGSGLWLRCCHCHFCSADVSELLQQLPPIAGAAWAVRVPWYLSLRYVIIRDISQLS